MTDQTVALKEPMLRRTMEPEVRYTLADHRDMVQPPVFVLLTPKTSDMAKALDRAGGGGKLADVMLVVHQVARLEGHSDAKAFGAKGTIERVSYVEAMDFAHVCELAQQITMLGLLTDAERKNSDAPSASATTTDGAPDAAGSSETPSTP